MLYGFTGVTHAKFHVEPLLSGECNEVFVGENDEPKGNFDRYPIYPTLREAIERSARLNSGRGSVQIFEIGYTKEDIKKLAARGKFNLGVIQTFDRDELATKDNENNPVVNEHFNASALETPGLKFK